MSGFDINTVTVTGNLTRDPQRRTVAGERTVCTIRIAHNDRRKVDGSYTDVPLYFDVTIWGGVGEWVADNLTKSQKVVVCGRLNWREYEDRAGGKRQVVDIVATSVIPAGHNGNRAP